MPENSAPIYLSDRLWKQTVAQLVEAAGDDADPHAAVAELLSMYLLPVSCRDEIERLTADAAEVEAV